MKKNSIYENSFFRFGVIGFLSNLLNFLCYVLTFLFFNNITLSSLSGYLLGMTTSFYFGKTWVFETNQNFQFNEVVKFLLVYFVGGFGMTLIIIFLNKNLEIGYKLSWIGGAIFAIINNYLGSKYIVFKNKQKLMTTKFGFLSKLNFLQDIASTFIAKINPAVVHNLEKYFALKKVHYLSAIEGLEGDYIEFGVFTGSSFCHSIRCVKKLSQINSGLKETRFYGFDSFEGFGELDTDDNHPFYKDSNFETNFDEVHSRVSKVAKNLTFQLIKGYFSESLEKEPSAYGIKKSRIIFIDSDTYSSAKEALSFIAPSVQEGTYFILDDYFSYRGSANKGVAKAFSEFSNKEGILTRHVLNYGMGGVVFVVSSV